MLQLVLTFFARKDNLFRQKNKYEVDSFVEKQKACNFTKINTPPWVFITFFKLYKWHQIAQRITYIAYEKSGLRKLTVFLKKCRVANRILEASHWSRSFLLTFLVCYYEFMYGSFLIYWKTLRMIFQTALVGSFFKNSTRAGKLIM